MVGKIKLTEKWRTFSPKTEKNNKQTNVWSEIDVGENLLLGVFGLQVPLIVNLFGLCMSHRSIDVQQRLYLGQFLHYTIRPAFQSPVETRPNQFSLQYCPLIGGGGALAKSIDWTRSSCWISICSYLWQVVDAGIGARRKKSGWCGLRCQGTFLWLSIPRFYEATAPVECQIWFSLALILKQRFSLLDSLSDEVRVVIMTAFRQSNFSGWAYFHIAQDSMENNHSKHNNNHFVQVFFGRTGY